MPFSLGIEQMEFLYLQNAFPIKIKSHSSHFDLSLSCVFFPPFKQKIATGKESRLNNLLSARIFFFLRSLSTLSLGHLGDWPPRARPNCSFLGKKLGNVQSSVSQLTVAFLVQSHISGWISWNFLLKKRVFLAWFQVLFFTAVILEFFTDLFYKPVGEVILSFSL